MTFQAQLVMILWLPVVLLFFEKFSPRKAIMLSLLIGFLFLPQNAGFKLPLIPDYRDTAVIFYGISLGILFYDRTIFRSFKPMWFDLPVVLLGIAPMLSSLSNGLGFYDGLNESLGQSAVWVAPYVLGRLYFSNSNALTELCTYMLKGGLLYVPLCLYEARMSPQIHTMVYGYFPHDFIQTRRFGAWRPQVFLSHGLTLALFMMAATLIAIWFWQGNVVKKIWGLKIEWVSLIMIINFILLRSLGAYILMIIGLSILFSAKLFKTNIVFFLLMAGALCYLVIAFSGNLNGDEILNFLSGKLPDERLASLQTRLENEYLLGQRARERILLGWGGWGRNRIHVENWAGIWEDATITDSLWVMLFGTNGLFGLLSYVSMMLIPIFSFIFFFPPSQIWFQPKTASIAVTAVIVGLCFIDWLLNFYPNPFFLVANGGFSGIIANSFTKYEKKRYSNPKSFMGN